MRIARLILLVLALVPFTARADADGAPPDPAPKSADEAHEAYAQLIDEGRSSAVLRLLPTWVEKFPKSAALHGDYAVLLTTVNKQAEARKELERAIELDGEEPLYHYLLALQLVDLGDLDAATTHFERAAKLDPEDADYAAELEEMKLHRRLLATPEPAAPPAEGSASRAAYDIIVAARGGDFAGTFLRYLDADWLDEMLLSKGVKKSRLAATRREIATGLIKGMRENADKSAARLIGWDIVSEETRADGTIEVVARGIMEKTVTRKEAEQNLRLIRSPMAGKIFDPYILKLYQGLSDDELKESFSRVVGSKSTTLSAAKFFFRKKGDRLGLYDASVGLPGVQEISLKTGLEHASDFMRAAGKDPEESGNRSYKLGQAIGRLVGSLLTIAFVIWLVLKLRRR